MKNTIQHLNEWNGLLSRIGKFESFIEIGTRFGGTFESLAERATGKKISIDWCDGQFGGIGAAEAARRNARIQAKHPDAVFIEGDSHNIKTVLKLNAALQGEKVDFLFIDGDHTYAGALADYMIYRQFVKQTGFIAFHDIVDSEFHRVNNCYVSQLWAKLALKKVDEWISPDNSDASEDAKGIPEPHRWGGIGLIHNAYNRHVEIFQPIYNQESINQCIKNVDKYIPNLILNLDNVYFEVAAMVKLVNEYTFTPNQMIGVTSPIQHTKTGLSIDEIVERAHYCVFLNYYNPKACDRHIWDENRVRTTLFYDCARELEYNARLEFDLFNDKWTMLYCNYFVCTAYLFHIFVNSYINPSIKYLDTTDWVKWDDKKHGLLYKGKYYPMAVFVLEGLAGLYQTKLQEKCIETYTVFKNGNNR